ncbi:MAG: TetR/AcrR family transcriptional regulator [Myxococcales bacterium]|nr:TetR/AcrR family transcriptional regulator [Myxococcales bacterium]
MSSRGIAAKSTYHHGNLPEALMAAAISLASEGQLASLSLRAVARRAGVSPAAPYRHFASREALLAAIAAEGYQMRSRATTAAMAPLDGQAIEQFLETGVQYVLFAHEHAGHYAIMSAPELADPHGYPELHKASVESSLILMESIRTCQAQGLMTHADAREVAAAAWASVHGLAVLISNGQLATLGFDLSSPEDIARRVARILVGNLMGSVES